MSFVAPLWLALAAAIGVGVVVAHLFSTSVPPRDVLPTVRFVPQGAPLAVLRTRRVSDAWLLVLRLLAVALLGLALAGAHVRRSGPRRVVLVDMSRAVGSIAEVRDSALASTSDGGTFIVFDSTPRGVPRDSVRGLTVSGARGSISAAMVAAHRALSNVSDGRDAVELVLVSPMVREEIDSATTRLLELWEGPVRVARVAPAGAAAPLRSEVRAMGDDPVSAALGSPVSALGSRLAVRVVRILPTRSDSIWARDSGGVLVLWPAADARGVLLPRLVADSQGGIASGREVVVGMFARGYQPRPGRVLVRWLDGEPAATEMALGRGCVREVAIPVDGVGDVALRESFGAIARSLLEPCGGSRDFQPASDVILRSEATKDLPISTQILRSAQDDIDSGSLPFWLGAFALAVLVAEQLLRARARAAA